MEMNRESADNLSCTSGNDIVASLLETRFYNLSNEEKSRVLARGRPRPAMKNLTNEIRLSGNDNCCKRHFYPKEYDKWPWLTGSESVNKLFCWPCLLFDPVDEVSTWGRIGIKSLNMLHTALQKHSSSQLHIQNSVRMHMFIRSQQTLHIEDPLDVSNHNEGVARNREILRRLVNAICYLVKSKSTFCDQNEAEASASNRECIEYLTLTAISEFDPLLGHHLALSTAFQSSYNQIQHDLIQALGNVVLNQIKQEVSEARYVAIILEETLDTMNMSWLTTVLRYVNNDGVVFERFIGYTDLSSNKTAVKGLFDHVTQVIEEFNIQDKLLAQAYDGAFAAVTCLCALMQIKCPSTMYVHSCGHALNSVLQKVCTRNIKECRLFFTILSGIPTFFLNSPKRKNALDMFMAEKLNSTSPTSWDLTVSVVNVVAEFLPQLIQFFEHVLDNSNGWDEETLIRAHGYIYFLLNFSNIFLLFTFQTLFSHTEKLDNVLRTKHLDPVPCLQSLQSTKDLIESHRYHFDHIMEVVQLKWAECRNVTAAARKTSHLLYYSPDAQKRLFLEIIDQVLNHIRDRTATYENLQHVGILNPKNFLAHNFTDSETLLKVLKERFPAQFDLPRLKIEFAVMLGEELNEIRDLSPNELVKCMHLHKLDESLIEIYKLLCLYLTLPSMPEPESSDWSFLASKRIQAFARASQGLKKPSDLAFLSIEKNLLCQMKELPGFYSKVIEEYTTQE